MRSHKDLDLWQKSISFVTEIYKITEAFPRSEIYGLISQIRRSAVSIPSNVAEGAGRQSKLEFRQFLYIALGSSIELETQLIISRNLGFIDSDCCTELCEELTNIIRMIHGLINNISKTSQL